MPNMCKSSSEPGGPQRCSGDARKNLFNDQSVIDALEAGQASIRAHAARQGKPWGPHIGPPPFAPPFAPDFDSWYVEEQQLNPSYSREVAYIHFYNLAGDEEDWAALGYTEGHPPPAATAAPERQHSNKAATKNAGLHAALRGAVLRLTDTTEEEIDAEIEQAHHR